MATVEQRLKTMLGERDFAIAVLETQLEQAQAKLDQAKPKGRKGKDVPDLKVVGD